MVSGHEFGGSRRLPPAAIFSGLLRLEAVDNGGMTVSLPSSIYIIMAKCLFNHPPFPLVTSVSFLPKTYLCETEAAAFRYLSTRLGLLLYSAKPSQGHALGLDISNEKSNLETSSSNISLSAHILLSFWHSPLTASSGLLSRDGIYLVCNCHSFCAHGEHSWSICHSFPLNTEVTLESFSAQDSINWYWPLEMDTIYHSNSNDLTHFLSTPQVRPCGWSSELFIAPPVPLHICVCPEASSLHSYAQTPHAVWVVGRTVWNLCHTTFVVSTSELPFCLSFLSILSSQSSLSKHNLPFQSPKTMLLPPLNC